MLIPTTHGIKICFNRNFSCKNKNIYHVGSLSLENLSNTNFLSKKFFEKKYHIKFNKDIIVIVFHPNTLKKDSEIKKYLSGKDLDNVCNMKGQLKNIDKIFKRVFKNKK